MSIQEISYLRKGRLWHTPVLHSESKRIGRCGNMWTVYREGGAAIKLRHDPACPGSGKDVPEQPLN
jgi:hypothetical protein